MRHLIIVVTLLASVRIACAQYKYTRSVSLLFATTDGQPITEGDLTISNADDKAVVSGRFRNGQTVDLPPGEYRASFFASFVEPTAKTFVVDDERNLLVIGCPKKLDDVPLQLTSLTVRLDLTKYGFCPSDRFVWAKLMGIFSDASREQLIDKFGLTTFRDLKPGMYLLLIINGKEIRATTTVTTNGASSEVRPPLQPCLASNPPWPK